MTGCPICDRTTWNPLLVATDMYTDKSYPILGCEHCGLARTGEDHDPLSSDLYSYGGSFDAGKRFGQTQWVLRAFREARVWSLSASHPGRVLDIGCGDGSFLMALARRGWDVFGTEASASIAASAQTVFGKRVHTGPVEQASFAENSFNLITFWHVLEHLDDPKRALTEARRLLEMDGRIIVAVPNIGSLQAHLFKEDWLHLDVPRHRWHFTPRTLAALADHCDLQIERIRHFSLEYGPFAILQGMATKCGLRHSLFTHLARLAPLQLVRESLFWTHLPLLLCAALPSLLVELGAAVCRRGGALVIILKQK